MTRRVLLLLVVVPLLLPQGVCLCHWLPDSGERPAPAADSNCCSGHDHEPAEAPTAPHHCCCGEHQELQLAGPLPTLEVPPPELPFAASPAFAPRALCLPKVHAEGIRPFRWRVPIFLSVCALLR